MDLLEWIKDKGWTITEFAKRLEVSRATVYLWLNKKKPSKYYSKRLKEFTDGKIDFESKK